MFIHSQHCCCKRLVKTISRLFKSCCNRFSTTVLQDPTIISLDQSFPKFISTISWGQPSREKGAIDLTRYFLSLSQPILYICIRALHSSLWWITFLFASFLLSTRRLFSRTLERCKLLGQWPNATSLSVIHTIPAGPWSYLITVVSIAMSDQKEF